MLLSSTRCMGAIFIGISAAFYLLETKSIQKLNPLPCPSVVINEADVRSNSLRAPASNAATGSIFLGEKKHTFEGELKCSRAQVAARNTKQHEIFTNTSADLCPLWAVVTTINEPTKSIHEVAKLTTASSSAGAEKWCMIIVGDTKTPNEAYEQMVNENINLVYLSAEDQQQIQHNFVQAIPYKSFARKNIGYLFAVAHGAQAIFDFDDDNVLKPGTVPYSLLQNNDQLLRFISQEEFPKDKAAFNPFPLMHPTQNYTWPRGFPLDQLQDARLAGLAHAVKTGSLPRSSIGVIQSVCDEDPDMDAIFRLTRTLPFTFDNSREASKLLVPPQAYSPYNAQATVHTQGAFWGLLLPFTVTGRVADIWRSYFTQRIMKDLNLALVYAPPMVTHTRSPHSYLADLQAEDDLYHKTTALLQFLTEWQSDEDYLPAHIEKLAVALHERDYIGLEDVNAMQMWLLALNDVGYQFPDLPPAANGNNLPKVTEQPGLRGQPFLAGPYFNVNEEGLTYPGYLQKNNKKASQSAWDEWLAQTPRLTSKARPNRLVAKLVMMTKNEWPLVKYWTLYHGELLGFQNLYMIDDSTDPRCTAFLRHARDHWGANVIFSPANLNQLTGELTKLGEHIRGSSDFTLKMDTDEFFVVLQNYTASQNSCKHDCTLATHAVADFLADLDYWQSNVHGQPLQVLYLQQSLPDVDLCHQGRGDELSHFPMGRVSSPKNFKAVTDSRSFKSYDLGGHRNSNLHSGARKTTGVPIGIIHVHHRCHYHEASNSKKAVLSHGFVPEAEKKTDSEILEHLVREHIGPQGACNTTLQKMKRKGSSYHKIWAYARSLECPKRFETEYYNQNHDGQPNKEFADFMDKAMLKYDGVTSVIAKS